MKTLKKQVWAKLLAVLLCTLCIFTFALSLLDIVVMYQGDVYLNEGAKPEEEIHRYFAREYAAVVMSGYLEDNGRIISGAAEDGTEYYYKYGLDSIRFVNRNNCRVTVLGGGKIIFNSYDGSLDYRYTETVTLSLRCNPVTRGEDNAIHIEDDRTETVELTVETFFVSNPASPDLFTLVDACWSAAYALRYAAFVIALVSLALGIMFFCFLVASAGHRRNRDGIYLGPLARIPLAVCLLLHGLFATALIYTSAFVTGALSSVAGLFLFFVSGLFMLCQLFMLTMNISARLKTEKWWHNTLTYMILHLLWCGIRGIFRFIVKFTRSIPLIWRSLLLLGFFFVWCVIVSVSDGSVHALLWIGWWAVFSVMFIYITLCLVKLRQSAAKLNAGVLSYRIETKHMPYSLRLLGDDLNGMGSGMSRAVEARMKSERMKTELITNVSHDIKTPLTSIINYVDLLGREELTGNSAEYVEVLTRQSNRLKKLIDDLIEASKASTGNIRVELTDVDLSVMTGQATGEYAERLAADNLTVLVSGADSPAVIRADGRLVWRIWDNLLCNISKYSLPGTRVYIDIVRDGERSVSVTFRNISKLPLTTPAGELTERFVRGDASRNSEGSGLGLSIASNLTSLMNGKLTVNTDGDLFKATVTFPLITAPATAPAPDYTPAPAPDYTPAPAPAPGFTHTAAADTKPDDNTASAEPRDNG